MGAASGRTRFLRHRREAARRLHLSRCRRLSPLLPRFALSVARNSQRRQLLGVELRTATTVESLIREGRRIIGLATMRGPLYAAWSFLPKAMPAISSAVKDSIAPVIPRKAPPFSTAFNKSSSFQPAQSKIAFVWARPGRRLRFLLQSRPVPFKCACDAVQQSPGLDFKLSSCRPRPAPLSTADPGNFSIGSWRCR